MLELENMLQNLRRYDEQVIGLKSILQIEENAGILKQKEEQMNETGFWNDIEKSTKIVQEVKLLKSKVENFQKLLCDYNDLELLIQMSIDEKDNRSINEYKIMFDEFLSTIEKLNLESLYTGEYDDNNAIVSLHAGAGGTESCDWVAMLFRMYNRYADKMGYKISLIESLDGDEAGIKSVTFEITGERAYGNLKGEKGVHRLVRISPFDSSGRRHTSFGSCDVLPVLPDDDTTIEIKSEEIKVDTYRASGAGGQHVNTTDSAIRITHMETGIVVQCQNERSQIKNRETAMKMLKAKLAERREQEKIENLSNIRGEVMSNSFGSQIRSYVFHPYNLVKDHRTNAETGNATGVMDGNISDFITEYLKWENSNKKM